MVERDCPPAKDGALPSAGATRRRLISVAATLLVLPVLPRLAQAATILAVRTWPADEYTRVTLELDSERKDDQADHQRGPERPGLEGPPGRPLYPEPARGAEPPERRAAGVRLEAARGAPGVHAQARGRLPVPAGAGSVPQDRSGPPGGDPEQKRGRRGRPAGTHPGRHPAQSGNPR
ncbi:hypothetical protein G6F65_018908 [Rhizopus arrhizus]|nr:hypothetical protein G6F65_018908 [Rhizopus arrhizus]